MNLTQYITKPVIPSIPKVRYCTKSSPSSTSSNRKEQTMPLKLKYFVLSPTKDDPYGEASRFALYEYAKAISHVDTKLSDDILEWLNSIQLKLDESEQNTRRYDNA